MKIPHCGTHIKGAAFGVVNDENDQEEKNRKIKLWLEEINGISQYIDDKCNVYSTEDIMNNVDFPASLQNIVEEQMECIVLLILSFNQVQDSNSKEGFKVNVYICSSFKI